jgi:hypothetical protein
MTIINSIEIFDEKMNICHSLLRTPIDEVP